ncbi:MAG TPA: helix-turn-helix domain-containing protein [Phycisphaerales bacterium]|nr:helix-turn-helix domain-containing protein [Phycisphaerales bacterium]
MGEQTFSLTALSELAGIEPRTIRSYIEKGLLPGPTSLGRSASYSQDHLDRLSVITLLRDAHRDISLEQIRALLAHLSQQQIRAIAAGEVRIGAVIDPQSLKSPSTSALDYLKTIRSPPSAPTHLARAMRAPPPEPTSLPPLDRLVDTLRALSGSQPTRPVKGEVWHRVQITPDIELSIRGPLSEEQLATVHRLGDQLRQLLTKGPSHDRSR